MALTRAYTTLRDELHHLALQELPGHGAEDCFTAERELVRQAGRSGWWKNEVWYYRAQILNLEETGMKVMLPEFERAGVMVVGDVMLDCYWYGPTSRHPRPEVLVPVVKVNTIEERPAARANQAMNIASLVPMLPGRADGIDDAARALSKSRPTPTSMNLRFCTDASDYHGSTGGFPNQQLIPLAFEIGFEVSIPARRTSGLIRR